MAVLRHSGAPAHGQISRRQPLRRCRPQQDGAYPRAAGAQDIPAVPAFLLRGPADLRDNDVTGRFAAGRLALAALAAALIFVAAAGAGPALRRHIAAVLRPALLRRRDAP
jgi:hypothetical protein